MAVYLSDAWVAELDAAAAASEELTRLAAGGPELTMTQTFVLPDGAQRSYVVCVGDGRVRIRPGRVEPCDVELIEDVATARRIAMGTENAQGAFLAGRVKICGDIRILRGHHELLLALDRALAPVRARTDFEVDQRA